MWTLKGRVLFGDVDLHFCGRSVPPPHISFPPKCGSGEVRSSFGAEGARGESDMATGRSDGLNDQCPDAWVKPGC